jgi:hypothetical protein
MTTLYEQFNAVRTAQKNWLYEPDVQQKLIDIFKIICDIDLSNETTPFKPDGGSFGMEIVYNYKFKYGRVYVQTEKKEMQVMFIFDDPYDLTIPFSRSSSSHRCTVKVDHDLNFVEGRFGFYTSFSNRTLDRDVSGFLILCFERVINSKQSFNSIAYSPDMLSDNYLDLIPHHLHKNYLIPNIDFEQVFMEFMTFCSENPEDFYNVFVEYPNYEQIISNVDNFVLFLNLFNQQYIENSALLQSRILLLNMQTI